MFINDDVEPPHKGGFAVETTAIFNEFIFVDNF